MILPSFADSRYSLFVAGGLLAASLPNARRAEMRELRHPGHADLKDRTWLLSTETCLVCGAVAAYPCT